MTDNAADVALIVVDVQNDFADPTGGLYVRDGEAVVPRVNEEIRRVKAAGGLIVYTQDWHPPSTPHFAKDGGIWPVHCVQDSWGAQLHRALEMAGDVVRKGTGGEDGYSGFTVRDPVTGTTAHTALAGLLEAAGVRRTVVVGLAGDVCVKATALDSVLLGYPTTVLWAAVRCVNLQPDDDVRVRAELVAAGVDVMTSTA